MPTNCDYPNLIHAGPEGTFQQSGEYRTTPADIDRLFDRLQDKSREGAGDLILYFHGGLVSQAAGMATAQRLATELQGDQVTSIYFIWETGFLETITANLKKVSELPFCRRIVRLLLRYLAERLGFDVGGTDARGTGISEEEFERELYSERPFEGYRIVSRSARGGSGGHWPDEDDPDDRAEIDYDLTTEAEGDEELLSSLGWMEQRKFEEEAEPSPAARSGTVVIGWVVKHLVKIAFRAARRLKDGTGTGFYPTVMEEVFREFYIAETGAWVWEGMKSKAAGLWKSNDGRWGERKYVGTYFLDRLSDYLEANPATRVHLAGHSAGSIAICHLLKAVGSLSPRLRFGWIVFLAPACRNDLFHEAVIRQPGLYEGFRCYTMSDENECRDALIPYVYPRSLLFLVSGILEDKCETPAVPILGLVRYHWRNENGDVSSEEFLAADGRIVLSETGSDAPPGYRTLALSHGAFDDDLETLASVKYILTGL